MNPTPPARLTLVLLPGLDGTGQLFAPLLQAFGPSPPFDLHVLRYPTDVAWGYAELEAFAAQAIPAQGPLVLLSESFSGPIAVALASALPARVRGLVLCCTFIRNPRPWLAPLKPLVKHLPLYRWSMRVLSPVLLGLGAPPALRAQLAQALDAVSPEVLRTRLESVIGIDVAERLATLRLPVLDLRARQDWVVPARTRRAVVAAQPQAQTHLLDGPHGLLQARPAEAAAVIAAFVNELSQADSP